MGILFAIIWPGSRDQVNQNILKNYRSSRQDYNFEFSAKGSDVTIVKVKKNFQIKLPGNLHKKINITD
ncbi:MAG: hypothetical protein C4B58_14365 [Deltaproteobacteria bacterium]|nr:MAG: hypothetical protein C4B58_14365 [Deltaproteobacteria bacterium]